MKKIYVFLFYVIFNMSSTFAQQGDTTRTSAGTEFIFSFSPNYNTTAELSLMISSEFATNGVISIPGTGGSISFHVVPGEIKKVSIPSVMANLPSGSKSNYGIKVISELPITIYGLNRLFQSTDAFLALPINALGNLYYAIGYQGATNSRPSQVAIVGVYDNTTIEIQSPVRTSLALAGVKQTVVLNRMETFLLSAYSSSLDITGTKISSDKPIAVTSGSVCSTIPQSVAGGCDHLVEMIPPVSAWGQSFITYPLAKRTKGDLVRVLASEDNTEIIVNGNLVKTLSAGTYFDLMPATVFNRILTSKPTLVAHYALSQGYDNIIADPLMMLVPSVEQNLSSYTFATSDENIETHYINVVIRSSAVNSVQLDGIPVSSESFVSVGDGNFSAARISINTGVHNIKASIPFALHVYGFGSYESYGYPGGMSTEVINSIVGDYKNVKVTSTLGTKEIEIDLSSFTVQPKEIRKEGDATKIEWFFPEFSIGQVKNLDFDVIAKNLLPGEKRVVTNSLEMTYQDLNGVAHNRVLGEQVLDVLSSGFGLEVGTNKQIYGPNDSVKISTHAANLGDIQAVVKVVSEIRDGNGVLVASVSTPPEFVLAGKQSLQLTPMAFPTATNYAGAYSVYSKLINSQGMLLAEGSASFSIVDQQAITGSIVATTDKYSYITKDTAAIEAVVKNLTLNKFLENVTARIRIVSPNNSAYWNQSTSIAQIAAGNDDLMRGQIPLADAIAGTYTVDASLIDSDGLILASTQASFNVVNSPLFSIAGAVNANSVEINAGESPVCNFIVNNTGASLIAAQTINMNLVRVDEASALFTQEQTVRLEAAESKSLAPGLPAINQAGSYACVLEASSGGSIKVLGSTLFRVVKKESPIKLTGDIRLGEKARLLVLMDASTAERAYLENLLTNAGWFYTIVDNAAAFATELNQGGYGVYALLSEKITLDQNTQTSLNTKVAAGDGLIMAGAKDRRHQMLEQALGIKARANEAYAKGVAVKDSTLGLGWQRAFNKSSQVLNFTTNGATVIGEYKNDLPGADTQTALGALGAASRYGNFVSDNFTSLSSTVEGRLAVGGNLNLQNFSVGDKLDPNKLHDVVTVGGNATFPSGRIYYGNLIAGGSVAGIGDAVRYGMATGATIKGNAPMPINFAGEREYLQELSTNLAALPVNGTVKMQWGGLELKGDCTSASQIFKVNGADLGTAHTFAVSCIPVGATVIFNVSGQHVNIKSMGMQSLAAMRDKVLFNFSQATSLSMTSVGIEGSILAPFAQVNQPAGRIDGQVIVKSWNSTTNGYMSIHNRFFSGDLSAAISPANKQAISVHQYQSGKSVFIGFDVLGQAVASAENPFAQLLLSALDHVNPAPIVARAGKTIPIIVTYGNTGAQTATGQVKLSVANNIQVISRAVFTAVANSHDWIAPLSITAGATRNQLLYVKLPQSGGGTIQLQLQTGTGSVWETRFEKVLNLQP